MIQRIFYLNNGMLMTEVLNLQQNTEEFVEMTTTKLHIEAKFKDAKGNSLAIETPDGGVCFPRMKGRFTLVIESRERHQLCAIVQTISPEGLRERNKVVLPSFSDVPCSLFFNGTEQGLSIELSQFDYALPDESEGVVYYTHQVGIPCSVGIIPKKRVGTVELQLAAIQ